MKQRRKILIVDDEPLNVDSLEQKLEQLGYETDAAAHGKHALQRVSEAPPDLILLDVMMPIMDGITACRILKEQESTRLIPVVIMTALSDANDRIKGKEAGARDFLTKPVNFDELRAVITTALSETEAREQVEVGLTQKVSTYINFVPPSVRRMLEVDPNQAALGKREQDASVLFVDICDYTKLSESLAPNALNALGETYFSAFFESIHARGGEVTETSGDGLMVVFHGEAPTDNAQNAVETALELQSVTRRLNGQVSGPDIALHMGINSGIASVGTTVYESPGGARWVYTADGFVVNVAARLMGAAKAHEILIGAETAAFAHGDFDVEPLGPRNFKNVSEPVDVFKITCASSADEL